MLLAIHVELEKVVKRLFENDINIDEASRSTVINADYPHELE